MFWRINITLLRKCAFIINFSKPNNLIKTKYYISVIAKNIFYNYKVLLYKVLTTSINILTLNSIKLLDSKNILTKILLFLIAFNINHSHSTGLLINTKKNNISGVTAKNVLFKGQKKSAYLKKVKGSLVYNITNKKVLIDINSDYKIHPASLTKIMTLYAVARAIEAKHISLDDEIVISKKAACQPRTRLDLPVGIKLSLRTAIYTMMTVSANDVTYAIGEALFGDSLEKVFNSYAKQLRMYNTKFKNCTGLPHPEQVTTGKDLMKLMLEIKRNYPKFLEFGSAKVCCCAGRCKDNTNKLLGKDGVLGFKTGFTITSGYHLITYSIINNKEIFGIFFGYDSSFERNAKAKKTLQEIKSKDLIYHSKKHSNTITEISNKQILSEEKNNKTIYKDSSPVTYQSINTKQKIKNAKTITVQKDTKTVNKKQVENNTIKAKTVNSKQVKIGNKTTKNKHINNKLEAKQSKKEVKNKKNTTIKKADNKIKLKVGDQTLYI